MGAFEDYISGSFQGLARGARELPENIANWARPAAQEGIKGYDGAITGTDLPYYGDDEISAAREQFDKQPRSNTSRLVDLIGDYMPGLGASKVAPVAVKAGETVLGAGPAFKQKVAETALDMAPEARAQRAAEQGYTTDVYHGTLGDVAAFDRRGEGGVTFVAQDPAYASQYAGGDFTTGIAQGGSGRPNVMPLKMRLGNSLETASAIPRQEAMRVLDLALDGVPPMMRRAVREDAIAKMGNADAVRGIDLYNAIERQVPVSTGDVFARAGYDTMRYGPEEWMVFKPENLRSRFAAFDPAKAGSSDLLAAHANPLSQLQQMYRDREEQ